MLCRLLGSPVCQRGDGREELSSPGAINCNHIKLASRIHSAALEVTHSLVVLVASGLR